jgi:dihydrofolate reductase
MRIVALGMMTTLNGRVDDPDAWMTSIGDDLYRDIDDWFEREVDTVLVGRTTYDEMYAYWPGAETDERRPIGEQIALQEGAWEINRNMARKMNAYKKFVFTRGGRTEPLAWNNAGLVVAPRDKDLVRFVAELKTWPGRDIHLAGGAQLAHAFVRLGLVDEFHLRIHPVLSRGATPFDGVEGKRTMELLGTTAHEGGVVTLRYKSGPG